MKKMKLILLTVVATSAVWVAAITGLLCLGSYETKYTYSLEEPPTNNISLMVLCGFTKEFALSFRELGNTPTNLVSTNNLVLTDRKSVV